MTKKRTLAPARLRVVALLRVSTPGQALEGYGLEVQEARVRAWAREHGHRLVAVVREEGVSGAAAPSERAGLVEALQHVADGRAHGLVVPSLDRLSRVMVVQEQLLAEVAALGGRLYSTVPTEDANLSDDPADPQRRLVRQIIGSIHEYERAMVRLRLRAGYEKKAATPGAYLGGRPPYGWAAIGSILRPLEHEQVQRRRIKEWNRQGWSYRKIADRLNAESVPTKAGGRWQATSVRRVVLDARRGVESPGTSPLGKADAERKAG